MAAYLAGLIGFSAAPAFALKADVASKVTPWGPVDKLDGKCFETNVGHSATLTAPNMVVWTTDGPCAEADKVWINAAGNTTRFNAMGAQRGEAVHNYFATEVDDWVLEEMDVEIFGQGDCYDVPTPKAGARVYKWQLACPRRGGHCEKPSRLPGTTPASLLQTGAEMDPVFATSFATEGSSQAGVAGTSLGDVSSLNGNCFETSGFGRVATVSEADIVVWDAESACPAGQSWIHYAGSAFSRMNVASGKTTHHFFAAKVANAADYEMFVGDCYDTPTPVSGGSKSMWMLANTERGGSCA